MRDFLDGVLGVVGAAHQSEVLPDNFFAGTNVKAGEVGVERAPALDAHGIFVAVRNARAVEGVCDDDLGFRADADTACGVVLGRVDFERLAGVGDVPPSGNEILVGFADGRHEHAAARMQFGEGLVEFLRVECREEVVDGRDVPFEDGRRCRVVVPLGNRGRFANLRSW